MGQRTPPEFCFPGSLKKYKVVYREIFTSRRQAGCLTPGAEFCLFLRNEFLFNPTKSFKHFLRLEIDHIRRGENSNKCSRIVSVPLKL